jgi:hypothetical protein
LFLSTGEGDGDRNTCCIFLLNSLIFRTLLENAWRSQLAKFRNCSGENCIPQDTHGLLGMSNFQQAYLRLVVLPIAGMATLDLPANAEVIQTQSFSISIERKCPEGEVTCNNVTYVGTNIRTGKAIELQGKTIHLTGEDGVTPTRFLGYEFWNEEYRYIVTADNKLQVFREEQLILEEQGIPKPASIP